MSEGVKYWRGFESQRPVFRPARKRGAFTLLFTSSWGAQVIFLFQLDVDRAPKLQAMLLIQRTLHAASAPIQHVRVNHRGAYILVSEEFLYRANVVAIFEQVGREAMSERMTTS